MLAMGVASYAVPAKRIVCKMKQSDGTTVQVYKHGSMYCAYYTSLDGKVLYPNAEMNGDLCYATISDGKVVPSSVVAHDESERTQAELEFLTTYTIDPATPEVRALATRSYALKRSHYASTGDGLGQYGKSALGSVNSLGSPKIPVILVNYADVKMQSFSTKELYDRILNEEGYTDSYGSVGSVRDYFVDNSHGLFTPDFVVLGSVTLSHDRSYYGSNKDGGGDLRAVDMVEEAVKLMMAQGVDFNQYTRDGKVENVIVLYAGQGEASGGIPETIWPHEFDFARDIEGIHFRSYFVGNELNNVQNTDGVGTMIHEFGHALGLPDWYVTDYSYTDESPFGFWSVMDQGCYAGSGYRPVGYTAYEKSYLGWLEIPQITNEEAVTLLNPNTSDKDVAVRINNPYSLAEYFILENRQPGKWYPTANGAGLLVSHFTYNKTAWNNNTLNNTKSKKRAHVVTADGSKITYSASPSMLFGNGVNNVTGLKLYSSSTLSDADIYRVLKHSDGTVTFNFKNRTIEGEYAPVGGRPFALVRSVDELATGDSVIVVSRDNRYAMAADVYSGHFNTAAITVKDDNTVLANDEVQVFGVRKNSNSWSLRPNRSTYLGVSRDGLKFNTSLTNSKFDLTIDNGEAIITFDSSFSNNCLNADGDNYYFNVVASNPSKVQLYKLDTASGIDGVTSNEETTGVREVYNLQGQRVNNVDNLPKGIYIINGKKTVVK